MSYLTRHFQMRGGIVGSMPNHTAREFMHKKLHGVGVPRKALRIYSKAVIGSTAVREHVAAAINFADITIGSTHRPKRTNQHTKDITVTGFMRLKGENLICYMQGDKGGCMNLAEWREKVRQA